MGYCMYEYHFYHYIIHLILKPWGVPSHTQQFFHWVIGHKILLWTKSHPCRHRTCKTSQIPLSPNGKIQQFHTISIWFHLLQGKIIWIKMVFRLGKKIGMLKNTDPKFVSWMLLCALLWLDHLAWTSKVKPQSSNILTMHLVFGVKTRQKGVWIVRKEY